MLDKWQQIAGGISYYQASAMIKGSTSLETFYRFESVVLQNRQLIIPLNVTNK